MGKEVKKVRDFRGGFFDEGKRTTKRVFSVKLMMLSCVGEWWE